MMSEDEHSPRVKEVFPDDVRSEPEEYTEHQYEILYKRQLLRNEVLVQRVTNLVLELGAQKNHFARLLTAVDPAPFGFVEKDHKFFRSWLIEFEVEMGYLLEPTGKDHRVRNLAGGYTTDGERELDLEDDHEAAIHRAAKHLVKLRSYMDL